MTIVCPGCGREYSEALFRFGRTINCACGRRVGSARDPRICGAGAETRFIADAMLGRLARWLRILGFDTAYEAHIADASLVRRAVEENRIILTRDLRLPEQWRVSGIHIVAAERPMAQLQEIVSAFDLAEHVRLFTRCNRCNTPLVRATDEEAAGNVPPAVLADRQAVERCPGCARFYWSGSHVQRMQRMLNRALGIPPARADVQ